MLQVHIPGGGQFLYVKMSFCDFFGTWSREWPTKDFDTTKTSGFQALACEGSLISELDLILYSADFSKCFKGMIL